MRALLTVFLAFAFFLGACQLFLGLEERPLEAPDASDAGALDAPRGDEDAADAAPDPCRETNVPERPRPIGDGGSDGGDKDVLFALYQVSFGIDGGLPFGLNLDRRCTCPGAGSCTSRGGDKCDEPAPDGGPPGVDNAAGTVLRLLRLTGVLDETTLNQNLEGGGPGALLRVYDYDGLPDDPYVKVALYASLGSERTPTGRPEDRYIVDRASVFAGDRDQPVSVDVNAYVSGSVLVAKFDFPLVLGGSDSQPPLKADLRSSYVVARIDAASGTLEGVLAGRWPTTVAIRSVQSFPDPVVDGGTLCEGGTAESVRTLLCGAADIAPSPEGDDKGEICEALSVHVGFRARHASFGTIEPRPDAGFASCARAPSCN